MKLGIDFKAAATKAAGHATGAALFTQLNKAKFLQQYSTPEKQATKGAIVAAIGYLAGPLLAKKMGLAGKGSKGAFVESACEGLGMIGVMIAANAVIKPKAGQPALFPTISGVEGYEENPINGLGTIYEENEEGVSGLEENPAAGIAY